MGGSGHPVGPRAEDLVAIGHDHEDDHGFGRVFVVSANLPAAEQPLAEVDDCRGVDPAHNDVDHEVLARLRLGDSSRRRRQAADPSAHPTGSQRLQSGTAVRLRPARSPDCGERPRSPPLQGCRRGVGPNRHLPARHSPALCVHGLGLEITQLKRVHQ